jgi:hypothetical protein
MLEQWNPLGTTGIITAFNFPVAVMGTHRGSCGYVRSNQPLIYVCRAMRVRTQAGTRLSHSFAATR